MGKIVLQYGERLESEKVFSAIRACIPGVGGFMGRSGAHATFKYFDRELFIDVKPDRIEFGFLDASTDVLLRPIEAFSKGLAGFGRPKVGLEVEPERREKISSRFENLL